MTSVYGTSAYQQINRSWEAKNMSTERMGMTASTRTDHKSFPR